MSHQECVKVPEPEAMEVFGLANSRLEAFVGKAGGDVQNRAWKRRDRNPPPRGHLAGDESHAVPVDRG
jgi:hypothetical protein